MHPFSAGKHKYTMQFDCWVQQNDVYKTQRAVRRRPVFVSREGMADILKRYTVKALLSARGAYFSFGPREGALNREGALIQKPVFSRRQTTVPYFVN